MLRILALAAFSAIACIKQKPSAKTAAEPSPAPTVSPDFLFAIPPCIETGCSERDKETLTAQSSIEARLVSAIDEARSSVQFSMFTFSRKPLFEALVRAAERGVKVQGLVDGKQFRTTAAQCKPEGCRFQTGIVTTPEFQAAGMGVRLQKLEAEPAYRDGTNTDRLALLFYGHSSGSEVRMPPGRRKLVHSKFVLSDGRLLLTGSGNWSSTAMSVNLENLLRFTRDQDGAILDAYDCSFRVAWATPSQTLSAEMARCQKADAIYFSPSIDTARKGIVAKIISSIEAARSQIRISMHHLVHEDVFEALVKARSRGVLVRVIVDDDDCNLADGPNLTKLLAAGAEFRYMPTSCKLFQLAHNKYGVFDDAVAINGSANWSNAGLESNYENFLVFDGARAKPFADHFEAQWKFARERTQCRCDAAQPECRERYCLDTVNPD